ncbi:MAG: hypothetical protein ACKVP4_05425 [Hyphomicrobium sp.]
MSNSEAAKKVQRMFRNLGAPPRPDGVAGNLALRAQTGAKEKSDRTEQLNLRVPLSLKKRVRLLATRDDISLSEVIIRAVALYEEKHGAAPEL